MIAYEKFEAWKVAHELALAIYKVSDRWPSSERFELTSQVRRAALSVPTNIAEGAAKRGRREFRRYLDIANGSLAELSYLLRFCKDRRMLSEGAFEDLNKQRDRAGRLTWGLYAALARSRITRPPDRPTD
jgi:four helix bundle protein